MDFKQKLLDAKEYKNIKWTVELLINLISKTASTFFRLNNNAKILLETKFSCELSDKAACFNTRTFLKSLALTVERLLLLFKILCENIRFHYDYMGVFLDEIEFPKDSFYEELDFEKREVLDQEVEDYPEFFPNFFWIPDDDKIEQIKNGIIRVNLNSIGVFIE